MKRLMIVALAICGTLSTAQAKQISNVPLKNVGIAFQDKTGEQESAEVYADGTTDNSDGSLTISKPYAQGTSGTVVYFSPDNTTLDVVCKVTDPERPFAVAADGFGALDHLSENKSTASASFVAGARVLIIEDKDKTTPKIKTLSCASMRPSAYF